MSSQAQNREQDLSPSPGGPLDILLPTIGSAGDVHPVIELGMEFKRRGHQATVVTNEFFEQQIRDAGLDFVALGTVPEAEATIADPRLWHPTKSFDCIVERAIVPNIERLYRIIEDRRGPRTLVAASGLCLGARIAYDKFGIPLATIHLQPALLRSLHDSGRQGRIRMDAGVPRLIKRTFFWILDQLIVDRALGPPLNSFRATVGLPPVRHIFGDFVHSPQLVIGLFPHWFAPHQPDWPPHTHLTGFLLHDDGQRRTLTGEVEKFLGAGSPPILFTPGSAAATLKGFFRESVEACRVAGYRALLVTNFPEQLPPDLPSGIRHFPYLPFGQILSRCSALVYPGGIGTMAQAIQAGVPHLVVPHGHDQPDNAARLMKMGLGSTLYPEKYKAARVVSALNVLLSDTGIRQRCREFSKKIDSSRALAAACNLIEGLGRDTGTGVSDRLRAAP
jgi:UDP:flavonoid glycosyltransferase YjiC (YdhE family)